jgi:hypothetical protein
MMSAIGANVPAGYMRGQEFGQQMQQQQLQQQTGEQELAQKQVMAQRGGEQYAAMKQAGTEAMDENGNFDPNRYAGALARAGVNVSSPYFNYAAKQSATGVRQQTANTAQSKALQAVASQEAYAMSQMPDGDRDNYFDNHTTHILRGLGAADDEIEAQRPLIHDDSKLQGMAQGYQGAAKVATQGQNKLDVAGLNAEARITAAKISASARLASVKLGFTDKPLSNPEAQYYKDQKDAGRTPEEAMQSLIDARSLIADAKKKNLDPATAASNAVAKIESTWGAKSEEKRDALFGSYVKLYSQATPPKAPAKLTTPSVTPTTKVNPDNGQTYYLWPDGKYHSTSPAGK